MNLPAKQDSRLWSDADWQNAAVYGLCPVCGGPRTVTTSRGPDGEVMSLVCSRDPAHDDDTGTGW